MTEPVIIGIIGMIVFFPSFIYGNAHWCLHGSGGFCRLHLLGFHGLSNV